MLAAYQRAVAAACTGRTRLTPRRRSAKATATSRLHLVHLPEENLQCAIAGPPSPPPPLSPPPLSPPPPLTPPLPALPPPLPSLRPPPPSQSSSCQPCRRRHRRAMRPALPPSRDVAYPAGQRESPRPGCGGSSTAAERRVQVPKCESTPSTIFGSVCNAGQVRGAGVSGAMTHSQNVIHVRAA